MSIANTLTTRECTRDAVLAAAGRLFYRFGYRKTAVDDIARESGVCRATIYLHFANKEEIALSWIATQFCELEEEIREIAHAEFTPAQKLLRILIYRVMKPFDRVRAYPESLDDLLAGIRPGLLVAREKHHVEVARILADVIGEGIDNGDFGKCERLETAELMVLATNALLPISLSARQLERRDEMERRINALADLLVRAIEERK
jgi:AcrR family transcriptional regulator